VKPEFDSGPRMGRIRRSGSWRWVAAAACGLVALLLVEVVLGGAYVPRKNAARDLRAKRQRIVALLAAPTPGERGKVEDNLDCVVRAVFRARLPVADVASLRQACTEALADGVITPEEAAGIGTAASELCGRAGGPEAP
jgi:hypothetical protein